MTIAQKLQPFAWPAYLVLLFGTALATLYVLLLMHTPHAHTPAAATSGIQPECSVMGETITVAVMNAGHPATIAAKRCDVLVFRNNTAKDIEIAFGPHEDHYPYPGLAVAPVTSGQSYSLVLRQSGSYAVHEHITDEVVAELTVNN